ncbi:DEAD/DEAH box helicase [Bacteroides reticulotermitis]|uniref:DEAD/DEAH box helicase n=1 Tax=Bacteroides reticulotermitis TaxID=1133319 RepID=UPI003A8581EA
MELKKYQQEVIGDLSQFIEQLDESDRLNIAYETFWAKKGISLVQDDDSYLRPYDNSVKGVPRVTVKVPTAGGKTFIACNALRTIFESMPAEKPKVVAWFVPSDTILKQTYKNLNDSNHPYRQKIDSHFGGAVRVVDKESALLGQGITPTEIKEQLTIFVLSVQSFAANNKDGRRVFRENENLADHVQTYQYAEKIIDRADETALIQVIAQLNPVVIIDESHNFEADLRIDMLNDINPAFILDLTATPRKKSNIISFVDAIKLKRANMVKLPVIVYNHRDTNEVIASAIHLQKSLEEKARILEQNGGRYIRPIVLFQAQPKTDDDNITFERIKTQLIEIGIPEEQIKIKTASKDEIKNLDLMSRDCEVRFIITVNALKEGWDCPFAYILASLANKSSRVDVEQILGRILRQPYAKKHEEEFLNLSYVFTASPNFRDTLENIIRSLNRAGFSAKDYRVQESQMAIESASPNTNESFLSMGGSLFGDDSFEDENAQNKQPLSVEKEDVEIDVQIAKTVINTPDSQQQAKAILDVAKAGSDNYNKQIQESVNNDDMPSDIADKTRSYPMKDTFKVEAEKICLPIFLKKVNTNSLFEEKESYVPLTSSMLAEDFNLEREDCNVDYTRTSTEAVLVDLAQRRADEYTPQYKNIKPQQLEEFQKYFRQLPADSRRNQLASKIARIVKFDEIAEPQIIAYIKKTLDGLDGDTLIDLSMYEASTAKAVKDKISGLLTAFKQRKFDEFLDTDQIKCENNYNLPKRIIPTRTVIGLSKHLYVEEGDMNDFERRVINEIANVENVLFWHRNLERGRGFCINGFINHYPDFIVHMKNGMTIIIETKGDDRDNSDSIRKLNLGKAWAGKAGNNYRYFMVFDRVNMPNAVTVAELINRLKNIGE